MLHSLLRLLFPLLFVGSPLLAQQDQRVSIEPMTTTLPEEIRIQAAASINSTTLVAWGGNRSDGGDSAFSSLLVQIVRDSTAIGSPMQAHSDQARPSRFVFVIPFDDRFLLLWNDRRDELPGIYSRWIGLDGGFISSEELFSTGAITDANGMKAYRTSAGVEIFWSDQSAPQPVLQMKHVSTDSLVAGEIQRVGNGAIGGIQRHGELEDLIGLRVDSVVRLLHADGTFDTRTIPASRFTGAYYFGADSTMAVLNDMTLDIYSNLFDVEPVRTLQIPALGGIPSNAVAMTTNGSGGIDISWSYGRRSAYTTSYFIERIVVADTVGNPESLDSISFSTYDPHHTISVEIQRPTTTRECGNGILVRHRLTVTTYDHASGGRSTSRDWSYRIDNDGRYTRVDPTIPVVSCYSIDQSHVNRAILRLRSVDTSTVRVVMTTASVDVRSAVSPAVHDVDQSIPNIFRRGERLVSTWQQGPPAALNVMAEWNPAIESTRVVSTSSIEGYQIRLVTTTAMIRSEDYRQFYDRGPRTFDDFTRSHVQLADSSWRTAWNYESLGDPVTLTTTYDPNRNESLGVLTIPRFQASVATRIAWIDSGGTKRREMALDSAAELRISGAVVVDSSTALMYSRTLKRFVETHNGVTKQSFAIDTRENQGMGLRRLYGPRFLRFYLALDASDPHFDIFSLQGKKEVAVDLPIDHAYSDPFFVESPVDSTIHILWASNNGVRLTRLDKYLRVLVRDSLISQTRDSVRSPAGLFRNDTLFAVWQDFRNATPDIYGTSFVAGRVIAIPPDTTTTPNPHDTTSTPEPPVTGEPPTEDAITVGSITPNPASGTATFALELTEPGVAVAEILDVTGQVIIRQTRHFDAGVQRWEIDVRDLANGLYLLSVQSGGKVAMTKLMVMRE